MPFILEPVDINPPAMVSLPTPLDPPDLLGDLPPFMQDSRDMQGVLTAIGNELARIDAARQDLISNFFPPTAVALLHFFEAMLKLPVDSPLMTLTERQQNVIAFMQALKSAGSGVEWENTMTKLVGTSWAYQEHDPADPASPPAYTILIRLPFAPAAAVPSGVALSAGTGTLPNGTYFYAVTATTGFGETLASSPLNITTAAGGVHVAWNAQAAPTNGFNVYRGTSPTTLAKVANVTTNAFDDDGSATPGAPPPVADSSASMIAATAQKLARAITPAHIAVNVGYTAGFLVGISQAGIDAL